MIGLTAKKGGVGVTTCCVHLAERCAHNGERTLLVDGDAFCACATRTTGIRREGNYTIGDYERGLCRAKQLLIQHPVLHNLYILGSLNATNPVTVQEAVNEIYTLFDIVLCDEAALPVCQKIWIVSDPYAPSLRSADRYITELKDEDHHDISLLCNKVNGEEWKSGEVLPPQEAAFLLHTTLAGVIPYDESLPLGKWTSGTKRAFSRTALHLCGKQAAERGLPEKTKRGERAQPVLR